MSAITTFVGVDASRNTIEALIRPTGELWTVETGEQGMSEIADKLSDIRPELVVMQANGGFELPMAGILATLGLPFALVQPRIVRDFARAIGKLTRTGQAGLLAHFAELVRPEAWSLSSELVEQLRHLRARRQEVLQMVSLEHHRAETAPQIVQKDLQRHIHCLDQSLHSLDEQFSRTIRLSRLWR